MVRLQPGESKPPGQRLNGLTASKAVPAAKRAFEEPFCGARRDSSPRSIEERTHVLRRCIDSRIASVSLSNAGPSPINTRSAPSCRKLSSRRRHNRGMCIDKVLRVCPTKLGFSKTVFPRTGGRNSRSAPSSAQPARLVARNAPNSHWDAPSEMRGVWPDGHSSSYWRLSQRNQPAERVKSQCTRGCHDDIPQKPDCPGAQTGAGGR